MFNCCVQRKNQRFLENLCASYPQADNVFEDWQRIDSFYIFRWIHFQKSKVEPVLLNMREKGAAQHWLIVGPTQVAWYIGIKFTQYFPNKVLLVPHFSNIFPTILLSGNIVCYPGKIRN